MKTKKKAGKTLRKSGKGQGKIREFDWIKKSGNPADREHVTSAPTKTKLEISDFTFFFFFYFQENWDRTAMCYAGCVGTKQVASTMECSHARGCKVRSSACVSV